MYHLKKKRILIVDHELSLLKSISITLKRAGYEVVAADSNDGALADILSAHKRRRQFHLVIMDHHLPVISGVELVDKIEDEGIAVPFAVITAFGSNQLSASLAKRNCLFCLDKPFDSGELLKCLAKAFEREAKGARS